jgi:hypothetical protein
VSSTLKHFKKLTTTVRPVEGLIHVIRGQKVMLGEDLAGLYEVPTRTLNQAVRRNLDRFPNDFMFQLTSKESESLRSQIVILKKGRGQYSKYAPLAFTEPGVAMLSSVLRSKRAAQMNILIMRAFIRMRELVATNKDIATRMEKLERSHQRTGSVIEVLVEDIDRLAHEIKRIKNPPVGTKKRIGYIFHDD